MNGLLKSAAKESSVKRFVVTSSSTAATAPYPGKVFHIDSNLWNETDIAEAWAPPSTEPQRGVAVYGASKAQAEKAVWEFVKEQKPHFVVNTVLPDTTFGMILDKNLPASTGEFVKALYNGEQQHLPPRKFPRGSLTVYN